MKALPSASNRSPIRYRSETNESDPVPSALTMRRRLPLNQRGLAGLSDRLDQVPLAHLGTAPDALLLCDLIELLPGSILESPSRLPAALPGLRCLSTQITPSRRRKLGDGLLRLGDLLSPPDVSLRRLNLPRRRHLLHLP